MSDKCYSTNNEEFNYTEAGEALQALEDDGRLVEGTVYYECDCEPVAMTRYLKADRILDWAGEQIYDEIGEVAEDAFSTNGAAEAELDALLSAWASKHITGQYWRCIGKPREIKVTADDVQEYGESHD
jgi:hypothetical protein